MHRLPACLLLLVTGPLAGCGSRHGAASPREVASIERAVGEREPALLFLSGWVDRVDQGPLVAGQQVRLTYAADRLPTCRGTHNGFPAWLITAHYRALPDETVHDVQLGNGQAWLTRTLDLPAGTRELELWFSSSNINRCQEWDSLFGANYRYPVSDPGHETRIRFGEDWSEVPAGPVVRGGSIRLDYHPRRLPDCRASYAGGRAWNIMAGYRFFPGGQTGGVSLYEGNYFAGEEAIIQPAFSVPDDADEVQIWFSNTDRAGCVRHDSDFGNNYRFAVEPAAAAQATVHWAGDWNLVGFHRSREEKGDVDPAYYWLSWSGSEYATWMEAAVWAPGITDRAYDSDAARRQAAERIHAEVVSDAIAREAGAEPEAAPLSFERQEGNNFVYSWRWVNLYMPPGIPDGLYRYSFRFSTDRQEPLVVGRPDGSPRRLVLAEQRRCELFPDGAPDECPAADLEVGWAGDWQARRSHQCTLTDLDDPAVFRKLGLGHDCMSVLADVWVDGFTDRNGAPELLTAQVLTDIGFGGGPLAELATYDLLFVGRVGNNYRYEWYLSEHVGRSEPDEYRYWFQFSVGDREPYRIGRDPGPDGGLARLIRVEP